MAAMRIDGVLASSWNLTTASYSSRPPYFTACEPRMSGPAETREARKETAETHRAERHPQQVGGDDGVVSGLDELREAVLERLDDPATTNVRSEASSA